MTKSSGSITDGTRRPAAADGGSKGRGEAELREAKRVWSSLDARQQWEVAAEAVHSRHTELRRAHRDIVSVGYGFASKGRGTRRSFGGSIAVCFMVRKKWGSGSRLRRSPRALPGFLLAYCTFQGERRLCAIPTDVAEATDYRRVRPHGSSRLVAARDARGGEKGLIAAVVQVPGDSQTQYALGCLHVLGLAADYWPLYPPSAVVALASSPGNVVGQLSGFRGALRLTPAMSFDAALAKVADGQALRQAAVRPRPTQFAASATQIPDGYEIWAQGGVRVSASKRRIWLGAEFTIAYDVPGGTLPVAHRELVESEAGDAAGDSGAPVVTRDGGRLLGMHIAGDGSSSFMIPSYELLCCDNYAGGLPIGQWLSLTDSY